MIKQNIQLNKKNSAIPNEKIFVVVLKFIFENYSKMDAFINKKQLSYNFTNFYSIHVSTVFIIDLHLLMFVLTVALYLHGLDILYNRKLKQLNNKQRNIYKLIILVLYKKFDNIFNRLNDMAGI